MKFTKDEKNKLIENCKNVISTIEKEYLPKLRTKLIFTFVVECRTKELRVWIEPDQKVTIFRGDEYSFSPVINNPYRYFYSEENADVQMCFLRNWNYMKTMINDQILKDNKDIEFLNSFTI